MPRKFKIPLMTGAGVAVAAAAIAMAPQVSNGLGLSAHHLAEVPTAAVATGPTVAQQGLEEFSAAREAVNDKRIEEDHRKAEAAKKKAKAEAAKKKAAAEKKAEAQKKAKAEAAAKRQAAEEKAARDRARAKAAAAAKGGTPAQNRALGMSMCADAGFSSSQCADLGRLWERESSWDERSANSSSGAYGIPQSLPGSKMASAGDDWRTNPATQIKWGLRYIKDTYGNPSAAWAHSQNYGWY
jgi:hypothetical protein